MSGLTTSGLILENNGDMLSVPANFTSFEFANPLPARSSYNVTVQQQPPGLTCAVSNGSGSNISGNITNVSVICSAITFTVGGTVCNLSTNGLILQNNGADDLNIAANASSFQFTTPIAFNSSYNVTIINSQTAWFAR